MSEKGFVDFVKLKRDKFNEIKRNIKIIFIISPNKNTGNDSVRSIENALLYLCKKYRIDYDFFLNENDFIKYSLENLLTEQPYLLIYNQSFAGPLFSRRILIPAFCGYNKLEFVGNDAYRMGLLCDKFHYYSILKSLGIPIAEFWYYHHNFGWITDKPIQGLKVIMKLSNENNKLSLKKDSVFAYNNDFDEAIDSLSTKYNQGVVLQKFIAGYEVTVPAIIDHNQIYTPNVLGLLNKDKMKFGDDFVTEEYFKDTRGLYIDEKYFNFSLVNATIEDRIKNYSHKLIKALGIRGFTRIDLRIDDSWGVYFNDIGSMPSISPNGAFQTIYEINGLSYEDFLITTICVNYK